MPESVQGRGVAVRTVLALLIGAALLSGCSAKGSSRAAALAERPIQAVTTANMITDLVRQVGGDRVQVTGLMGPGVDPHLYKASAGDVRKLTGADITFYGGLHLEGKMTEILEKLGKYHPSVAVTDGIPPEKLHATDATGKNHDPHVWFDVSLWRHTVGTVRDALKTLDPTHASTFEANASAYAAKLEALDAWVKSRIASIPKAQRVMITAHDAFGYFGARYGLEVRGLQGLSTTSEAGARDVQDLAAFIAGRKIGAVFIESSVPRRTVDAVRAAVIARGHALEIGGELFSDSAGAEGTPEGSYTGMIEHNVNTIVEALK